MVNCEMILYSRTFDRDYRWLIDTTLLCENERDWLLNKVFYRSKTHSNRETTVYWIKFSKTSVVVSCGVSSSVDRYNKPISYLQGYCSPDSGGFSLDELNGMLSNFDSGRMVWDSNVIGGFLSLNDLINQSGSIRRRTRVELAENASSKMVLVSFDASRYAEYINHLGKGVTFVCEGVSKISQNHRYFDLVAPITLYTTKGGEVTIVKMRPRLLGIWEKARRLPNIWERVVNSQE